MAAAVETRKRFAIPFVNDDHVCRLAKRVRYTTPYALHPLDGLRGILPDASPRDLEACFAASGGDIHATVQAYRDQQAKTTLVACLAQGGVDECAGVLVDQMAAATDASDARNRASWILGLVKNEAAAEAARLREENGVLREQVARLREEAAVLRERAAAAEQGNEVLRRDVLAVVQEYM